MYIQRRLMVGLVGPTCYASISMGVGGFMILEVRVWAKYSYQLTLTKHLKPPTLTTFLRSFFCDYIRRSVFFFLFLSVTSDIY